MPKYIRALILGGEQMRAVGVRRHQTSAVERRACAHAARHCCRRLHDEWSAHAVSLRADLLGTIHLALRIEPGYEGCRVAFGGARCADRSHQRRQLGALGLVGEVEVRCTLEHRRLGDPIERVRHQHRVALGGEALCYLAHRRAQPECIGPDQDTRVRAVGRVDECRIACSVSGFDLDVRFDDLLLRQRVRPCRPDNPRRNRHRHEVSSRDLLVGHACSSRWEIVPHKYGTCTYSHAPLLAGARGAPYVPPPCTYRVTIRLEWLPF
jgi:hypothetical protein